jgi:5-methylcytosine-specific restriction endonuclease McrA
MRQVDIGEYPSNWRQIAKQVKDEAGWRCVRCQHEHEPKAGYCLTVHHLDADKGNCQWWNLAPLCQRCHLSIQGRVIMQRQWMLTHSEWLRPYVAGYYASINGLPTNKEFVMPNIDYLIAVGQGLYETA